ncbi:hypothetical protein SELMODRAFT_403675 [Selaginella moellendorffii]|uniref:Splicing factor Cactin n=1 Tax=Selaginella moellendorffii TaxID=88036 RepID=D8QS63_SELML|nr:cactin [Selaginella moellendorffii]EFJ36880.1 hypothetical protein SELMODRAFT_403675 [Selaginella moellendorffii]|eukprot:XP_002961620.1 cactin [Selaginella moellendorffii]
MGGCVDLDERRRRKRGRVSQYTEEEIHDYLVKKAQRKAAKVAKKLKPQLVSGYSDDSNPFGDSNLTEKFVWRKKIERDIANKALNLKDISVKAERVRQEEQMKEIEKVKKKREERAMEKAKNEEEKAMLARERARAEFQDWEKKEEEFLFHQREVRAEIRIKEGRATKIDLLSKLDDLRMAEPYLIFKGLSVKEMEKLREELRLHLELDRKNTEFWEAMTVVCDSELAEGRKREAGACGGEDNLVLDDAGLHTSIDLDVNTLLQNMTSRRLQEEQAKIEEKLRSGSAKNVEFWESVLKRVHVFKAKAQLREIAMDLAQQHHEISSEKVIEEAMAPRSPEPIPRQAVRGDGIPGFARAELGKVEDADAEFGSGAEVSVESDHVNLWRDKYSPRKPKYLNRVHTGYEWNKYNQTHYDHDSPPPKTVQGYKFNIFYPDLIDWTKAPTFAIERDGISGDTAIIRFTAGAPYEDIAFRIVNKEWERSPKNGFKCTFERGILCVYFNFKRYRYRR